MSENIYTNVDRARLQKLDAPDRVINNRLLRWQRQSVVRSILPHERVSKCYRVRTREMIDVFRSKKFERAHYAGLVTCSSVWTCPVCSSKITERRRIELQSAIDKALSLGMSVFLVTWTLQHSIQDTLNDVRLSLGDALRKLKAGRWYQGFISDFGIVGNVTGSEVTYGPDHGWHYHKHSIFFSDKALSSQDCFAIREELSEKYLLQLQKLGRWAHPIIGVDVRMGDQAVGDYVAKFGVQDSKWTLAAEVTKGHSKTSMQSGDHFSPFEFLDMYLHGVQDADKLFAEYAKTMKGDHQLRWSKDLRSVLDLDPEISDEEIAAVQDEDAVLFAQLTINQWRKILKSEKRGQLLEVASSGNIQYFQIYLTSL